MKNKQNITWEEAFFKSPGPRTKKEAAILALKGLCMGSADIIPGVSGGTIALITGIYENLLTAIKSLNTSSIKQLLKGDVKGALAGFHLRFLACLLLGIGTAVVSLARLMNYLLHHQPVFTWSLFFGLIAASILVVGKKVERWNVGTAIGFAAGVGFALFIVNLIPVSTPETYAFIFLSGFIAICAMILPGISGAFILLILGKYEFITATLKNPFLPYNMIIVVVFCAGCLAGLLCFSRLLHFLLQRFHNLTLAFLTGLMAGSMQKIWPWKEVVETCTIRGKEHVLVDRNILPDFFTSEFALAAALAITGIVAVLILERLSQSRK